MFLRKLKRNKNDKLFDAFSSGDLNKVRKCVQRGANVNHRFPKLNQGTLLHYAPNIDMMRELLNLGADINAKDYSGSTPLHVHAARGEINLALELIRVKADVNVKNSSRQTPLHLAVINKRELILIQELLKSGADVNCIDQFWNSPLKYAVSSHLHLDVSKELLKYGGSLRIKHKNHLNFGPFEEALMGDTEHAKLFVRFTVLKRDDFASFFCWDRFTQYPCRIEMLDYMDECWNEVDMMKKEKIGTDSLYNIVVGTVGNIKPYCLINMTEEYFSSKYSIYSYAILEKLSYWLVRARLLFSIEFVVDSNTLSHGLNHDCFYKIAEFLPNDDLENLIEALNMQIE